MRDYSLQRIVPVALLVLSVLACAVDEDATSNVSARTRTYAPAIKAIGDREQLCGYDAKGRRTCASTDRLRPIQSSTPYRPDSELFVCSATAAGELSSCVSEPSVQMYDCNPGGTHCGCNGWVDCVNMLVFSCDEQDHCDPFACPAGGDYDCCCTFATE